MNENQDYEEIDLVELFRAVLRKWWLIVLLVLLASGSSYYVTKTYVTPIYEAKSTLFIGKESDLIAGISLSEFNLGNKLVVDIEN